MRPQRGLEFRGSILLAPIEGPFRVEKNIVFGRSVQGLNYDDDLKSRFGFPYFCAS